MLTMIGPEGGAARDGARGRRGRAARALCRILGLALALLAPAATDAAAAAGTWQRAELVEARLVSAVDGAGQLAEIPLGVEMVLKPGWKTYWRSPGDAGLPPTLDWSGSTNLGAAAMRWPAPRRFELFGLQTFGYADRVVLPVRATPAEPGRPLGLAARLDVLVCAELCVPQTLDLALGLPAGPAEPGAEAQLVSRFENEVPGDGQAAGLAVERAEAAVVDGRPALQVTAAAREPFAAPDLFVEAEGPGAAPAFGAPEVAISEAGRRAVVTLPLARDLPAGISLAGRTVTLTLVDGPRAVEARAVVAPGEGGAGRLAGAARFAGVLGLALLGGFVLNLMPCVLPVLSLKLVAVVGRGGDAPARVRADFLATAAGVVASFLALALGLVLLKAGGRTVGWGIQFQEPAFVAAMVAVVTLFACNLWGLFEVPTPAWAGRLAGRRGPDRGLAAHFATGAFATLLATPCSAPFLGTAVGFALAGGMAQILAVFLALGLGLALPYLAVAAVPRLAAALPRPGRWMQHLRRALAIPLALTALWLLGVMAAEAGRDAALLVGGLMVALVGALALGRALPATAGRGAAAGAAALLVAAALAAPAALGGAGRGPAGAAGPGQGVAWVPFDRDAVRGLVAQGRTVFVDVTADWCLTCQVNKRLVIEGAAVAGRLGGAGAVAMRADWTRPDPAIADFLASHGRYGIPFDVVFGPGRPAGVVLPELLTEAAVLDALDLAGSAAGGAGAGGAAASAGGGEGGA